MCDFHPPAAAALAAALYTGAKSRSGRTSTVDRWWQPCPRPTRDARTDRCPCPPPITCHATPHHISPHATLRYLPCAPNARVLDIHNTLPTRLQNVLAARMTHCIPAVPHALPRPQPSAVCLTSCARDARRRCRLPGTFARYTHRADAGTGARSSPVQTMRSCSARTRSFLTRGLDDAEIIERAQELVYKELQELLEKDIADRIVSMHLRQLIQQHRSTKGGAAAQEEVRPAAVVKRDWKSLSFKKARREVEVEVLQEVREEPDEEQVVLERQKKRRKKELAKKVKKIAEEDIESEDTDMLVGRKRPASEDRDAEEPLRKKSGRLLRQTPRTTNVEATAPVDEPPPQHVESSRSNRATARRRAQGLEEINQVQRAIALSKGEMSANELSFKFNQLQTRKKHLRFARSPIHDWGLYAMERIGLRRAHGARARWQVPAARVAVAPQKSRALTARVFACRGPDDALHCSALRPSAQKLLPSQDIGLYLLATYGPRPMARCEQISYLTMPSNTAIELNVGHVNMSIQTSLSPGDTLAIQTNSASRSSLSVQLSLLPPAALSPSAQERASHKRISKIKRPRKVTKRAKTSTGGNPDAITSDFSETEVSESDELFYATRSVEDPSQPVRIIRRVVHDLPIMISPRSKKQAIPPNVPRPHPDAKPVFIRPANADRALAVAAPSVSYVEEAKRVVGKFKTE
ncbi:hypothetical protein GGX14DRAFT_563551 [Mycena pura]|uniref:Uncharacterized protein n=1 Tax=Mycena pura TaxID=153505 RepID=A0AAD6VR67_9AGAR|nr:hypothetical protein GGX14DRAFT_563551 [Mycena pura]